MKNILMLGIMFLFAMVMIASANAMTITPPSGTLGASPYSASITFTSATWDFVSDPFYRFQGCTYIVDEVPTTETGFDKLTCWDVEGGGQLCNWVKIVPIIFSEGTHTVNASCTTYTVHPGLPPTFDYYYDTSDGNTYEITAPVILTGDFGANLNSCSSAYSIFATLGIMLFLPLGFLMMLVKGDKKTKLASQMMGITMFLIAVAFALMAIVGC